MSASSADIYSFGLDMFAAVLEARSRTEAAERARAIASDLTADELRRVATFLAVEGVRGLPSRRSRRLVNEWIMHKRLAVLMDDITSGEGSAS